MAAVSEVHAQDAVADVEDGDVRGHVRLRAGMRLDVDMLRTWEERQGALLREPLDLVHELAPAVVALAGQALGVLVGEPRTLRLEHGTEGIVLARDQLDLPALPLALTDHRIPQLGIDVGDGRPGDARFRGQRHGLASLPVNAALLRWRLPRLRLHAAPLAPPIHPSSRRRSTACRRG